MRVNRIVCPKCSAALTSKAGVEVGTAIACPKCKQKFAVAALEEEEVVEDFEVVDDEEEVAPKKPAKTAPKKRIVDEDEEEEKPVAKKRRTEDDEEEDRPRRSRRREKDGDEEERPRAKKRARDDDELSRKKKKRKREAELSTYGKLKANIWVRVGVLGTLLTILGVVAYQRFGKKDEAAEAPTKLEKNDDEDLAKPIKRDQLKTFPKKGVPTTLPKDKENDELSKPKVEGKDAANERVKFQGSWKVVAITAGDLPASSADLPNLNFIFKDDTVTIEGDPKDVAKYKLDTIQGNPMGIAKFRLDPSKSKPEIDIVNAQNAISRGIYDFTLKDSLRICFDEPRPMGFFAPGSVKRLLVTLHRGE